MPAIYEIEIEGHLSESWSDSLQGLSIHPTDDGHTVLNSPLPDQAALHGVLVRIRDLGLPLVAVRRVDCKPSSKQHSAQSSLQS